MKILVTGATGFIGTYLVDELSSNHDIYALSRSECDTWDPPIHCIRQDLTMALDYDRLPQHIDAVIHLAQSRNYRAFPERADDIFGVNVSGTFHLLEYARQASARHFLLASSGGVYGYSYEKFVESDPVDPLDFYLSSKYTSELLTANYQAYFTTAVFRFFFVYGLGQKNMLMPSLIDKVRNDQLVRVDGNPGIRINPIHVSDAVRVFEPALQLESSDVFNVSGDEVVTITDLVCKIENAVGKKALVEHSLGSRNGDLVADNSRMKNALGVEPRVSLHDGLRSFF
jgi:UDP-glucose 4-epimerase